MCGVDADARCVSVGGGVRGRTSPGGVRAVREQPRGRRRRVLVVLISFSSRCSHLVVVVSRRRVLVVLFSFSSRRSRRGLSSSCSRHPLLVLISSSSSRHSHLVVMFSSSRLLSLA